MENNFKFMTIKTKIVLLLSFAFIRLGVYAQEVKTQNHSKSQSETIRIDFTKQNKGDKQLNIFFSERGLQNIVTELDAEFISKSIKVPIENPDPFLTIAAVWEADNYFVENVVIRYRTSTDGDNWSSWDAFEQDEHSESDDEHVENNKYVSSLLFLDKNIKHIQYSVLFLKGSNAIIKSLRLDFFSPGYISDSEIEHTKKDLIQKSQQTSRVACPCPALTYVPRTGWNSPVGQGSNCSLSTTTVTTFVLHHQAAVANPPYASVVLSIYNYHVNTNGWCDVGYNWLIAPDGTLYQGRGWVGSNDNTVGGHMCACNGNKMGVCLLGDYTNVTPSVATYNKLKEFLAWKACSFSINPTGTASTTIKTCCPNNNCSCSSSVINTIIGHQSGCASCTSCPGTAFFAQIPTLRNDVQAYMNSCGGSSSANDDCSGATILTSSASCVNTAGDVSNATASGVAKPSCDPFASPALLDVWYKFTATSTAHTITVAPSASFDAVVALYTSCTGGEIGCADTGGGSGATETINATSLTIGNTYYIRVYDYGSVAPATTTFNICVTNCTVVPNAVSVSGGTFCNSATLTASGGSGGTIYWQNTTSGGISTATASVSQTVTSSGTYYFRAYNTCGWGTQGSATVIINNVDTSITKNEFTLTSNATPATYQWVTCPGMQLINGETSQSYSPSQNGNYAVIVSQNNCIDTSNCYQVSVTGLSFTSNATSITVYPNPTNNLLIIKGIGLDNGIYKMKLTNSVGQLLTEKEININNTFIETQFDLTEYSSAIYFLTISSKTINPVFKIQKQ